MKIEHLAFNVDDPVAMARWYVAHLGLAVKRQSNEPPYGHFLADDQGTVMIELYRNPEAPIPVYPSVHPLSMHLAFVSLDIPRDVDRLVMAGATVVVDIQATSLGDQVVMLRDPWGLAIQLVDRKSPMI